MIIDILIILYFLALFFLGRWTTKKILYNYYPRYQLTINGNPQKKKLTQKQHDLLIKKAKDNPYHEMKPLD